MTLALWLAVALGAVTVGVVAGWAVAAAAWLALRAGTGHSRPAQVRARLFAQARLAPLAGAVAFVPVVVVAFLRFEPARGDEVAGPVLLGLAGCAVLAIGEAAWAAVSSVRATARLRAAWQASATPLQVAGWQGPAWQIDEPAPVAAVVGVRRPALFLSSRVVTGCSAAELAAIAAHESAHVRAHDNLVRWAFRITPGARLASRVARGLDAQWTAAAEEVADGHARVVAGGGALASALVKVARLAAGGVPPAAIASAFVGGDSLEHRVRRVLAPAAGGARDSRALTLAAWWLPAGVVTLAAAACASPWLVVVHAAFESLVSAAR